MKMAVSSYSFGDYLSKDKLGIRGCMDWAKEQGFEGLELVQHNLEKYDVDLNEVAEYSKKIDMPIVAYLVYKNFLMDGGKCIDYVIESAIADVDKAAFVGAPMFRHDVVDGLPPRLPGKSFDDVFNMLADGTRKITEYAASLGIKTSLENHGHFLNEAAIIERFINTVNHENFGLMLDMGNFLNVDEDPAYCVGKLARYAYHAHGKDYHFKEGGVNDPGEGWHKTRGNNFLRGAILGHGDVNIARAMGALRKNGYDGWITVEFEGIEDNLLGIRISRNNLMKYMW